MAEKPTLNYRDEEELKLYNKIDFTQIELRKGIYRSIHYVIHETTSKNLKVHAEIQARTIFEEGWSQINHEIYKNAYSASEAAINSSTILSILVGACNQLGMVIKQANEHPLTNNSNTIPEGKQKLLTVSDIVSNFLDNVE